MERGWGLKFLMGKGASPALPTSWPPCCGESNRPLLVRDRRQLARRPGSTFRVTARDLDKLVGRAGDDIQLTGSRPRPAWLDEREFYLAWPDQR